MNDRRAPGCEKKSLEMHQNLTPFDYEQKKMLAVKAMQSKPNPTDYRVPNSAWTGYGLSQSTPLAPGGDMNKVKKHFFFCSKQIINLYLFDFLIFHLTNLI